MTCNIHCHAHNTKRRNWEVTPEGRVWPCCYFSNAWDTRTDANTGTTDFFNDQRMQKLMKDDFHWNSLEHHALDDIIAHEVFQTHIFYEGWSSDNPPPICVTNCSED